MSSSPRTDPAAGFAALGEPTRLAILARLSDGVPRSISALSAETDITRQAVTKHLRVLENAGLIAGTRVGRESRFTFRPESLASLRAYLDQVSAQWDDALGRLKAHVEQSEDGRR